MRSIANGLSRHGFAPDSSQRLLSGRSPASGPAATAVDVVRIAHRDSVELDAGVVEQRDQRRAGEGVMVQQPVLVVRAPLRLEAGPVADRGVAAQVVKRENLFEVRQVVLCGVRLVVGDQVRQRRDRPPVVERARHVRRDDQQAPAGPGHAPPVAQRAQRVGQVLDDVGAQDRVVALVVEPLERDPVDDEHRALRPVRPRRAVYAGVLAAVPDGLVRELAAVETAENLVDRQHPTGLEDPARAADLESADPAQRLREVAAQGAVVPSQPPAPFPRLPDYAHAPMMLIQARRRPMKASMTSDGTARSSHSAPA